MAWGTRNKALEVGLWGETAGGCGLIDRQGMVRLRSAVHWEATSSPLYRLGATPEARPVSRRGQHTVDEARCSC